MRMSKRKEKESSLSQHCDQQLGLRSAGRDVDSDSGHMWLILIYDAFADGAVFRTETRAHVKKNGRKSIWSAEDVGRGNIGWRRWRIGGGLDEKKEEVRSIGSIETTDRPLCCPTEQRLLSGHLVCGG
jgi:hypothetical protein